jgi:hypothetical protein
MWNWGRWVVLGLLAGLGCARQPEPTPKAAPVAAVEAVAPATALDSRSETEQLAYAFFHFQRVIQMQEGSAAAAVRLSDDQVQLAAGLHAEVKKLLETLQLLKPAERQQRLTAEFTPAAQKIERQVDAVISPEQREQLYRLVVKNQRGAIVLLMPGVPERLQLSAEQKQHIEEIIAETTRMIDWDNIGSIFERLKLVRRALAAREQAMNLLDAEQTERWQQLTE